jgi:hypothetical protein
VDVDAAEVMGEGAFEVGVTGARGWHVRCVVFPLEALLFGFRWLVLDADATAADRWRVWLCLGQLNWEDEKLGNEVRGLGCSTSLPFRSTMFLTMLTFQYRSRRWREYKQRSDLYLNECQRREDGIHCILLKEKKSAACAVQAMGDHPVIRCDY